MPTGCHYFNLELCRACALLEAPYAAQLARKQEELAGALSRLKPVQVLPFVPSEGGLGSRHKAKLAAAGFAHAPRLGIYDSGLTFTELEKCPLHTPLLREILEELPRLVAQAGVSPYEIKRRRGELKYVIAREAHRTGRVIVRLVCRSRDALPRLKRLAASIADAHAAVHTVTCNVQPEPHSVLEGAEEHLLRGDGWIPERFGSLEVFSRPQSFMQVTPGVAEKLYAWAGALAQERAPRHVLDLYCGIGLFGLHCAPHAGRVSGVERSSDAISAAERNAVGNGIENASFRSGDAEDTRVPNNREIDFLIVNPPRGGLSPAVIELVRSISPRWFFYSSCNIATQLRDLTLLEGYRLVTARGFDMFPLTPHYESALLLERR